MTNYGLQLLAINRKTSFCIYDQQVSHKNEIQF